MLYCRTEWIDAISKVSKELRKTEEPANPKSAPKTEGATVAKQGIKVSCVLRHYSVFMFIFCVDHG